LESCALGHLEQHVFNIIREQDDVPGYLIPQMYLDYLRSGDPSEMHRVIYHNATDVLSMVTLTAHVLNVFATPFQKSEVRSQKSPIDPLGGEVTHKPPSGGSQKPAISANQPAPQGRFAVTQSPNHPSPEDLLRLACWHDDNGRAAEAEAAYRRALEGQLELGARTLGLTRLAALLKRANRRAEAAPLWEQLASFTLDDPEPFVELAKFYEWHAPDFALAERWAERALAVVTAWPRGWRREAALAGLKHRGERLQAKLTRAVTE
ncbi:MAG: ribonuclease H-like domain-containing protein, partial [Anaerolineales bacterium]